MGVGDVDIAVATPSGSSSQDKQQATTTHFRCSMQHLKSMREFKIHHAVSVQHVKAQAPP